VAITADNSQLILSSLGSDKLFQFNFDDRLGLLTPEQPSFTSLPPNSGPRHLRIHPNGNFLYVIGELDAKVYVFSISPDGSQIAPLQTIDMLTPETGKRYAAAEILFNHKARFCRAKVPINTAILSPAVNIQLLDQYQHFFVGILNTEP
jgi:6-phosphogluconolactonase